MSPKLIVEPQVQTKESTFGIKTKRINGLRELRFWTGPRFWSGKGKEFLWDANLHNYTGSKITYGKLPRNFKTMGGRIRSASEVGKAKTLPKNKIIYMEIGYQYDDFLSASLGSELYSFKLTDYGAISNFKKEPSILIDIPSGKPNPKTKKSNKSDQTDRLPRPSQE